MQWKDIFDSLKHSFGVRWGRWRWPLALRNANGKLFTYFSGSSRETSSVFDTIGQERAHRELGSEISVWPKQVTEDVWSLPIVMCEARSVALYVVFCWARVWGDSKKEVSTTLNKNRRKLCVLVFSRSIKINEVPFSSCDLCHENLSLCGTWITCIVQ